MTRIWAHFVILDVCECVILRPQIMLKYIPDIKPTDRKISTLDLAKDDRIVPEPIKNIPILVVNL